MGHALFRWFAASGCAHRHNQEQKMDLNELLQQRQELLDKAQAIANVAEAEGRDLTDEESAEWGGIMDEKDGTLAALNAKIRTAEKRAEELKRLARERENASNAGRVIRNPVTGEQKEEPRVYHKIARLRAFRGDNAARDAYDTGMWLRAVAGRARHQIDERAERHVESRGFGIRAAQTEDAPASGGYLVPAPLAASIIDNREVIGIARRVCDVVPMSADTLGIPKVTAGLTVYAPGEGSSITASDATYGRVNLSAKKRAVLNQISSELSDDALVNMADRGAMEMARALALQEDKELIDGDGTATYFGETGLLDAVGSAGVSTAAAGSTWTALTMAEVMQAIGLLPSQYWVQGELAIICSAQFYHSVLVRLMLAQGGATVTETRDGIVTPQFLGVPVVFTAQMPTATATSTAHMIFGNFRQSVILGDRTGVNIGMSADYAFADDVLTLRATSRYDFAVHEPGDSSAAGGYVVLNTHA
jgi:HK97 family phage major capsid protein